MALLAKTKPSNTVKVALWTLVCIMLVVVSLLLTVVLGAHYEVDSELLRVTVEGLTSLGASAATLGGAATLAKGGRDAVADYAGAKRTAEEEP